MLYTEFHVGGKALKLRITARACVAMEKKLGRNPVSIFLDGASGNLPTLSDVLTVIHASLQALEHGYTEDAVYRLYDEYVEEGHNMYDLIPVIIDVFKVSGIFTDEAPGETDPNE